MLLVTGAAGFLGSNVLRAAEAAGREVVAAVRNGNSSVPSVRVVCGDLTDRAAASEMIASVRPQWVLNCAALANLDECERDPSRAREANTGAAANLAMACAEFGARLAHVSTDSVFDGSRGRYVESDVPSPLNVYAQSKLEGENEVRSILPDALVVRTNFIGMPVIRGSGLADWIATSLEKGEPINGYKDVIFSPLLATTLAEHLLLMMDSELEGLYHLSARDSISKYDFAVCIAREMGHANAQIARKSLADMPMTVRRPLDTSLVPSRVEEALGVRMPSVDDAVVGFVAQRRASNSPAVVV